MNKFNFVRDGAMRLPPGFRFQPTDEELVFQYLKCKVFSFPLPASIIPDINLCKYDPWDLPGELGQEKYFFSSKEAKYRNGNRINRATASGYWKATGSDRQIASSRKNQLIVGMKKTLVFYKGKPPHGSRTNWVMHEYRLVITYQHHNCHNLTQNMLSEMEKWAICHVFKRKRISDHQNHDGGDQMVVHQGYNAEVGQLKFFDFLRRDTDDGSGPECSSSSSSNSSGITAASSSESYHDLEESCSAF